MTRAGERGAKVRIPPPLVYLAAIGAGWALDRWTAPLAIGLEAPVVRLGAGSIAALAGMAALALATRDFRATGQDPKPWKPTPELLESGVYAFSRNPIYLGFALLQVGVGFWIDNLWVILMTLPALAVVHLVAVRPEETYLEERFGAAYRDYRDRVRRWL